MSSITWLYDYLELGKLILKFFSEHFSQKISLFTKISILKSEAWGSIKIKKWAYAHVLPLRNRFICPTIIPFAFPYAYDPRQVFQKSQWRCQSCKKIFNGPWKDVVSLTKHYFLVGFLAVNHITTVKNSIKRKKWACAHVFSLRNCFTSLMIMLFAPAYIYDPKQVFEKSQWHCQSHRKCFTVLRSTGHHWQNTTILPQ